MPSLLVLVFAVIIDVARATADDAAEIGATVDRVDTRPLEFQELLTTDIPCSIQRYASVRDGVAVLQQRALRQRRAAPRLQHHHQLLLPAL